MLIYYKYKILYFKNEKFYENFYEKKRTCPGMPIYYNLLICQKEELLKFFP
jgi:hypothetical protein